MTGERQPVREFYRDNRYRTLGEQYNNLGNITQGSSGMWPGQIGIGWDGRNARAYKAFETVEDGIAAQAFLLERYLFQNGDTTFHDLIRRYAPSSDGNNVPAYVGHVAGKVDRIVRSLDPNYDGPTITGQTNLRQLIENPRYRDVILAATVKAMNEVEVGQETSDRLAPAATILRAIQTRYANAGGAPHEAFQRYSRAIGRDPGIRRPSPRRRTGDTEGEAETSEEPWHQPTERDIDGVMESMMRLFVGLLLAIFVGPERAREVLGGEAPSPSDVPGAMPQMPYGQIAGQGDNVGADLNGDGQCNDADQNIFQQIMAGNRNLFSAADLNRDGRFTNSDVDNMRQLRDVREILTSAGVVPSDASACDVLQAFVQSRAEAARGQ